MDKKEAAQAALLTDKDLAKRWGVSVRTIGRWRAAGKTPPSVAIGHRGGFGQGVRYRLDDVIAFEDARKIPGEDHGSNQEIAGDTPEQGIPARSHYPAE